MQLNIEAENQMRNIMDNLPGAINFMAKAQENRANVYRYKQPNSDINDSSSAFAQVCCPDLGVSPKTLTSAMCSLNNRMATHSGHLLPRLSRIRSGSHLSDRQANRRPHLLLLHHLLLLPQPRSLHSLHLDSRRLGRPPHLRAPSANRRNRPLDNQLLARHRLHRAHLESRRSGSQPLDRLHSPNHSNYSSSNNSSSSRAHLGLVARLGELSQSRPSDRQRSDNPRLDRQLH